MKAFIAATLLAATLPTFAADVGVSIGISQPGIYGRVDIGRFPQPSLVMPRPVWVAPPPVFAYRPDPVYLWVPPGHRAQWPRYCGRYEACNVPVYFVQDGWYRDHVMVDRGQRARGRWDRDDRRDDRHGRDDRYDRGDRNDRNDRNDRGDRNDGRGRR